MYLVDYNKLKTKLLSAGNIKKYIWWHILFLVISIILVLIIFLGPLLQYLYTNPVIDGFLDIKNREFLLGLLVLSLVIYICLACSNWNINKYREFEKNRWNDIENAIDDSIKEDGCNTNNVLSFVSYNLKDDVDELKEKTNRNYTILLLSSLITAISNLSGYLMAWIFNPSELDTTNILTKIGPSVILIVAVCFLNAKNDIVKTFWGYSKLDNLRIALFIVEERLKSDTKQSYIKTYIITSPKARRPYIRRRINKQSD